MKITCIKIFGIPVILHLLFFLGGVLNSTISIAANKEFVLSDYEKRNFKERKLLQKDSLITDLNLLMQALQEMHPGLYRYNSQKDIEDLFADLKNNLPDHISEGDFMIRLAQTIRQIKCGHTYLNPWNMKKELRNRLFGGKTFFPIGFKIVEGRFFVTENAIENSIVKRGAEILEINGIPVKEIYAQLKTIAKTDGNNYAPVDHYLSLWNYQERNWHAFDLYLQLFYPLKSEMFQVGLRNYKNEAIQSVEVPAMTKAERAAKMVEKYGATILEKKEWQLQIIDENLAVMRLGTFAIWNWKDFDPKRWFADAFHQLDSLGIEYLAIDIRGNGGGLSAPADELMSYLINNTLECDDLGKVYIRTTKFNPKLLPYIDTWVEPLKKGLPENLYVASKNGLYELLLPSECSDILPKTNRFKGKAYIFGNASNVSATYTLLEKAKNFDFATFIGQESGGNKQGINGGEYAFFYLPYSKMEVDIPLKYFAPYKPEKDQGVRPDKFIKVDQESIAKEKDPYLEYVQQNIRSEK